MATLSFLNVPPSERVVVVGAGIVGSHVAAFLAEGFQDSSRTVILLDRDVAGLPGSTSRAPGLIGQYNTEPALTELAKRSVAHYLTVPGGFDPVGGLEVAETEAGAAALVERGTAARKANLTAQIISRSEAARRAPDFVRPDGPDCLWFEGDGTADPILLSRAAQEKAQKFGAHLVNADVLDITPTELKTSIGEIEAKDVVLCTNVWAGQLSSILRPVVPVGHPYSFSPKRMEPRTYKQPFIRWPESHVYGRDHDLRDGIGSYNHKPIAVPLEELGRDASGKWDESFRAALSATKEPLPTAPASSAASDDHYNGIFAVTPDGLPLVGQLATHRETKVWCAVAVWVTHAAGSARLIADAVLNKVADNDRWLLEVLSPTRFEGQPGSELEERALFKYNDIYNKAGH